MSTGAITVAFFDLGDTLGTPVLSPPPRHLIGFDVFPFSKPVLSGLRARGLRLGVISNTGEDDGPRVNGILQAAGPLTFFDSLPGAAR